MKRLFLITMMCVVCVAYTMAQISMFVGTWSAYTTNEVIEADGTIGTENWKLILKIDQYNSKYRVKIKQEALYEYQNRPKTIYWSECNVVNSNDTIICFYTVDKKIPCGDENGITTYEDHQAFYNIYFSNEDLILVCDYFDKRVFDKRGKFLSEEKHIKSNYKRVFYKDDENW